VKNGTIWEGGSFDPETRILYVYSEGSISSLGLVPPDSGKSDMIRSRLGNEPDAGYRWRDGCRARGRITAKAVAGRAARR
jgi:hypothetical protein